MEVIERRCSTDLTAILAQLNGSDMWRLFRSFIWRRQLKDRYPAPTWLRCFSAIAFLPSVEGVANAAPDSSSRP